MVSAVKQLQNDEGLAIDGIVYMDTHVMIEELLTDSDVTAKAA